MVTEDNYEEVNKLLQDLAAEDVDAVNNPPVKKLLIASGEDCQFLMFGELYHHVKR